MEKTINNPAPPAGGSTEELTLKLLRSSKKFREAYMKDLIIEDDTKVLIESLRPLITYLGGVQTLSEKTGLGRTNLYKILSGENQPTVSTLFRILNYAGYGVALKKLKNRPRVDGSLLASA